jgi:hypothetical protein
MFAPGLRALLVLHFLPPSATLLGFLTTGLPCLVLRLPRLRKTGTGGGSFSRRTLPTCSRATTAGSVRVHQGTSRTNGGRSDVAGGDTTATSTTSPTFTGAAEAEAAAAGGAGGGTRGTTVPRSSRGPFSAGRWTRSGSTGPTRTCGASCPTLTTLRCATAARRRLPRRLRGTTTWASRSGRRRRCPSRLPGSMR